MFTLLTGAIMTEYKQNEDTSIEEIDLLELYHLFVSHILLIVGLTVVGALLALGFTTFMVDPTYQSSSTVYIQPTVKENQVVASDLTTNQKLTATYTEIAKSNTVINQVVPSFRGRLTKESMVSSLTIKSIGETQIISISAVTTDPILSAELVNKVVSVFQSEIINIMAIDNLTVIDKAVPNEKKVGPNRTMNTLIGAVLGFMLAVGYVLLRTMLNRTIQTRTEAERLLDLPVLGEIYFHE